MNLSDGPLLGSLQRLLGAPRRGRGTDPFDWFLRSYLLRAPTTPLVVWNLGGAADAENWPRAVQNAISCARDAGPRWSELWGVDWRTTPIVYIVSDRSSVVLKGLNHRLAGDEEKMAGEFGHWTSRFRFDVSGWRQYAFLDATDARRLARTPELPIGNRIASAAIQATVVGSLLAAGPPLLVVLCAPKTLAAPIRKVWPRVTRRPYRGTAGRAMDLTPLWTMWTVAARCAAAPPAHNAHSGLDNAARCPQAHSPGDGLRIRVSGFRARRPAASGARCRRFPEGACGATMGRRARCGCRARGCDRG